MSIMFECNFCSGTFKNKWDFGDHLATAHKIRWNMQPVMYTYDDDLELRPGPGVLTR